MFVGTVRPGVLDNCVSILPVKVRVKGNELSIPWNLFNELEKHGSFSFLPIIIIVETTQ